MTKLFGAGLLTAVAGVALGASVPALQAQETAGPVSWNVDMAHSEVGFKARHFFTPVTGTFHDFEVSLAFDPENPENSAVEARIAVASVDTGNERRDGHLQSDDFFDAAVYPDMTFRSTSVRRVSDTEFVATGELTIKGTTVEIELPITLLGIMDMPENMRERFGSQVASFQAGLTADRRDFDVGVGSWAETVIVGADIEISITIEAGRQ
jgi:polyisoprenoid-binding protein YceI